MNTFSAINLFGVAAAVVGIASTSVALQAGRQALVMPRVGREPSDWPILMGLGLIIMVDLAIIVAGVLVAVVQL